MSRPNEPANGDVRRYVRQNRELIARVLMHAEDAYSRACALVLLTEAGSQRDVEAVKEEVDRWT